MDVFKLQKINSLASDLRKHNFADSSQDAFQQAEQVFENVEKQEVSEETPVVVQKTDHLAEKRAELLIDANNKKYDKAFADMRVALSRISGELESLKADMRRLSEQAPPKPKEKQEPLKTEAKEEHPRQGKFSPADVDIQKMFYFGTRK